MQLSVLLSREAEIFLRKLAESDLKLHRIMVDHLRKLPEVYRYDPLLKGKQFSGIRKHRVGDYRILYSVKHAELIIYVITMGHRRDVYDR